MSRFFKILSAVAVITLSVVLLITCSKKGDNLLKTKDDLKVEHILGNNKSENEIVSDLNLKFKEGDVTITWKSSNEDVITNKGLVKRLNDFDVEVTLTATFTLNDSSETKDFKFIVLKDELKEEEKEEVNIYPNIDNKVTINNFLKEDDGYEAKVLGVVTSLVLYNSYTIEDDTGALTFTTGRDNIKVIEFDVGDLVVIEVEKTSSNGIVLAKLTNKEYEVIKGDYPNLDVVNLNDIGVTEDILLKYQSRVASVKGLVVEEIDINSYKSITIQAKLNDQYVTVKYDSRIPNVNTEYLETLKKGDTFDIENVIVAGTEQLDLHVGKITEVIETIK